MTLQQAENYVKEYQHILADEEKRGGRRNPTLLPASKEELMRAIKLLMAQLYRISSDTEEQIKPLLQAAMFIDSFSDMPLDSTGFITSMQGRRREILDFHRELRTIPSDDQFFWQRVYPLVGIGGETRRNTIFETIWERLKGGGKEAAAEPASSLGPRPTGRIAID